MLHGRRLRGAAGLVALLALALTACSESGGRSDGGASLSLSPSPSPVGEARCEPVETFADQGHEHIEVGNSYDDYNSSPPTSGPHWTVPADPGFHAEDVAPEQLVHNLEHGQIVVYYHPDVHEGVRSAIEDLVQEEPIALVAAPYDDIEAPNLLIVTAWTHSMSCTGVVDEAIASFRARFQGRGPEDVGVPAFEDQ
jgi:Protein of unknown function (DUF3105)